jgi:hypothetical protein
MRRKDHYVQFFHPEKSPHAFTSITGKSYAPKHTKSPGKLIWDASKKGTFKGEVRKLMTKPERPNDTL